MSPLADDLLDNVEDLKEFEPELEITADIPSARRAESTPHTSDVHTEASDTVSEHVSQNLRAVDQAVLPFIKDHTKSGIGIGRQQRLAIIVGPEFRTRTENRLLRKVRREEHRRNEEAKKRAAEAGFKTQTAQERREAYKEWKALQAERGRMHVSHAAAAKFRERQAKKDSHKMPKNDAKVPERPTLEESMPQKGDQKASQGKQQQAQDTSRNADAAQASPKPADTTAKASFSPPTAASTSTPAQPSHPKKPQEPWGVYKSALEQKFGETGWAPRKRISPDAIAGIRSLHSQNPSLYSTAVLAQHFKISAEAIRRILKGKWEPSEAEAEERRRRWEKRGERKWSEMVELGVRPPKKWRDMGVGRVQGRDEVPRWKRGERRERWIEAPDAERFVRAGEEEEQKGRWRDSPF
ncbi:Required for respiratory growth protein 9 mitochondrial [Zalaria obscura]|uniref:Required for respiratory growth protein 9 mitochondrial n=1 Tax=Zalaria obscura TaxID=2024903 RepID=A0ACC3SK41_9PEZI